MNMYLLISLKIYTESLTETCNDVFMTMYIHVKSLDFQGVSGFFTPLSLNVQFPQCRRQNLRIFNKSFGFPHHFTKTRQLKAWHPLAGRQTWPWPMTPRLKFNRVSPLIIHNLHVKFESDWAKTVVCILSTRSYTQNAKVYLDLWPRDPIHVNLLPPKNRRILLENWLKNWRILSVIDIPTIWIK